MLDFIFKGIVWVLAIYGLIELIKTIIYTYTYTNLKSNGIYIIVAVKNQANQIEGFIRTTLFRIIYGKEENIKNISKDIKYYIKTYNKGEIIAHEDDECRSLSLVLSGVVEIQRLYLNGKYIVLNRLNEGDVFGEALVFSEKALYPATVLAVKDCLIMYIKKEDIPYNISSIHN